MKKVVLSLLVVFSIWLGDALASEVRFDAFGDAPYREGDEAAFLRLVDRVNASKPDFAVHVGDFKSGVMPCSDEVFSHVYDLFGKFEVPLIYTPGDNEWTDCHRPGAGGYDPVERLSALRRVFYRDAFSLGQTRLALNNQSSMAGFEAFVENARWSMSDVLFATLHVVGSNNNRWNDEPAKNGEFEARMKANLAWLDATFTEAARVQSKAVVIFMQADPQFMAPPQAQTGYAELNQAFYRHAKAFQKPVLLVHGDTHVFIADYPLLDAEGQWAGYPLDNFQRLEVFGDPTVGGVRVTVRPEGNPVFVFEPYVVKYGR